MGAVLTEKPKQSSAFEMLVSYGLHKLPSVVVAAMLLCL